MGRVWYWADLHVGHALVAGLRGFADPADHDAAIADAWTATVRKDDTVWILGDLALGNPAPALELIAALPGTKHLVFGNHDRGHPMHRDAHRHQGQYLQAFDSVQPFARHRIDGRQVLLSHFPHDGDHEGREDRYTQWRLPDLGSWLIHGHIHDAWKVRGRQINVGVDHWAGGPADQDQLAEIMRAGAA